MQPSLSIHRRIVDRLLAEGHIDAKAHQRVIEYATRQSMRVEDAVIALDVMSEAELLKYLATLHRTRFVSTDKLMRAAISPRALAQVPRATAELHGVYPVLFDEAAQVLSVVTADPDNDAAMDELKAASGLREVRALVARPAAVSAAIGRDYRGDIGAFGALARERSMAEVRGAGFDAPPAAAAAAASAPGNAAPIAAAAPSLAVAVPREPSARGDVTASSDYLETLNVLVSLLEHERQDLRGHSSNVARLVASLCERSGVDGRLTAPFVAAAYLHDVGKAGLYHLTALNVATYEGHRAEAIRLAEAPLQLMEAVSLAPETIDAVRFMYERYDGHGFPSSLVGEAIPLGARILAVADSYADLTQNPRNPHRRVLRPAEAQEVLMQHRGTAFDPAIVDLFQRSATGPSPEAGRIPDRLQALLADPDPRHTSLLELRMIEQGFDVRVARTLAQARAALDTGEIGLVVSEVDLDEQDAGLVLRAEARERPATRDIAWVILTTRADRQTAQRAFELGVDDFSPKPAATEVFVAKLRQLAARRAIASRPGSRGVSGSLSEMALPDLVQVLWQGRKTGALRLEAQGYTGSIYFVEGQIHDAEFAGLVGEDAFYRTLTLQDGDFRLDAGELPASRRINASPEGLLLEGMRRIDEG